MVSKDFVRGFLSFLDKASDQEIQDRKTLLKSELGKADRSREFRADINFLLGLIQQEEVARFEANSVGSRSAQA